MSKGSQSKLSEAKAIEVDNEKQGTNEELLRQIALLQIGSSKEEEKPSRVWSFLNQPFILFLLSSVALSGITWLYQERQQEIEAQTAATMRVSRGSAEIFYRMTSLKRNLRFLMGLTGATIVNFTDEQLKAELSNVQTALNASDSVHLFPEYAEWSSAALAISAWMESIRSETHHVDTEFVMISTALNILRDTRADMRRLSLSFNSDDAKKTLMMTLYAYATIEESSPGWEISMPTHLGSDTLNGVSVTIFAPGARSKH